MAIGQDGFGQSSATELATSQPDTKVPAAFRPDIEGLRAVAVLAVVLFHAGIPGFSGGFVGVDVFFVISGFLITGMLWREASASGTVSLRRFWAARARRLLPASATVGVITMVVSAFALPPLQVKTVALDAITSALYVSNYWFIGSGLNYFGRDNLVSPSPFKHYWSLGVEEQFYLIWPVLIIIAGWLLRRLRRRADITGVTLPARPYIALLATVVVMSFALSLVLTYIQPYFAYLSLPTRAWQLATGGLVALTVVHWRRVPSQAASVLAWVGLAMILLSCLWLDSGTEYPGTAALLPTAGAALVIGAGCASGAQGCGRVLSLSPMRAIGRISYSWYLWHWPVLVLMPVLLGHALGLPLKLAAMGLSAVLAMLTLRYIENPLRFSDRIRRSPRDSLLMGAVATVCAASVGVVALVGTPLPVAPGPAAAPLGFDAAPTPPGSPLEAYDSAVQNVFAQVNSAVTAAVGVTTVPSNLTPPLTGTAAEITTLDAGGCMRSRPLDSSQPECVTGNRSSPTTIALIGDSHASMWRPAVQQAVDQRGWRMLLMSKISCPIVDLPLTEHLNGWSEWLQPCAQWRSGIMARLRAERPQLVIVAALRGYGSQGIGIWDKPGFEPFNPGWVDGLARLVAELRSYGSKVLVLGPEPKLPTVAPNCLSAHMENAQACDATWPVGNDAGIESESSVVVGNGGQYANTKDLFCSGNQCPAVVGNTMVFYDASHISSKYSLAMGPAIGALMDRALFGR